MPNYERADKPGPQVSFDADALTVGLAPIADRPIFATWRLEPNPDKPDKPRKVPYVRGGRRLTGAYSDPALPGKLMPLAEAVQACYEQEHDGVGLVFTPGCGAVGLDIDHCIDGGTGEYILVPEQKAALAHFVKVSFLERSQSGTGLHAIALGDARTLKANGRVELFGDRNFLALTGASGAGVASLIAPEALAAVAKIIDDTKEVQKAGTTGAVIPFVAPGSARPANRVVNGDVISRATEAPDPERAASALAAIASPTDWEDWLDLIWAFRAAGGEIDVMISHSWPGSEDTLRKKWNEYNPNRANGIGPGTLYKLAMGAGWQPPRPRTTNDSNEASPDGDSEKAQPTDLWLSRKFVSVVAVVQGFLYDHSARKWRNWHNGSWQFCERGEPIEAMKAIADALMAEARRRQREAPQSEQTKKLLACAHRAQSAQGIKAPLELAQSAPELAVSAEDFDTDPDLLNVANGVIHLPSGELRAADPALMLFRQSPVNYDPNATCPLFERFMLEISCNDPDWVDYMQRCLGYALSGHVGEEKMFCWLGNGANGKSLLANVIMFIMGSYAGMAPSAFLMLKGKDSGGATPDTANLAGRRIVMANEVEAGSTMSGQTVKVAVSTEAITARRLYGAPFTFKPTHKLFLRGNHRPIINDNDEGIWRRIALIMFDLNLMPEQRDQGLEARLLGEAPGILAWMVRGFAKWRRDGLRPARRVHAASLAYRNESDLLAQWVTDCCDVGRDDAGMFTEVQQMAYANYRIWCHEQGLRQYTKKSFTRGLVERGFGTGRQGSGERRETYTGIKLKR